MNGEVDENENVDVDAVFVAAAIAAGCLDGYDARIELSADWVLRSELGSDARSLLFLCSCVHDV